MSDQIEPFHLSIPEAQLVDLRDRLARTRWPERETVQDTSQGPPLRKVQALCEYWRDRYDWRRCEAMLNGFGQFRTTIDGLGIHFLHIRSPEPDAMPLILTHGWPGSVLEFAKVIGPLTNPAVHGGDPRNAFHLVVPSLSGFGFSDKPAETGWGVPRIADAWITLMDRLGHARWGAQGGDWGGGVTTTIGRKAPAGCVGIHLNFVMYQPTQEEVAEADPHEQAMITSAKYYEDVLSGYAKEQSTRPQTIGYSLSDSPAGLASWIYAMFQDISESGGNPEAVLSLDEMLDDIMLYWLPNTGASSARLYWEAKASMTGLPPSSPLQVPTAISMFPGEIIRISRRWADRRFGNLIRFNELKAGGHFAAMEQPAAFVEELRASFGKVRAA